MGASPAVALIAVALCASLASAEVPAWLGHPELTGHWGGWRDRLADEGVTVAAGFTAEIFGNPVGGVDRGVTAVTTSAIDLWFDLDRLLELRGTRFHVSGGWRTGRSLSEKYVGNAFPIQEAVGSETIRLVTLAIEQSLFADTLHLAVGRLSPGDDFATSDLYCYLVQNAFCGNPYNVLIDAPSFATFPITVWGARARATPTSWGYVTAGVYQADLAVIDNRFHGIDFGVHAGDGVISLGEVGWLTTSMMGGRQGRLAAGGWYDSSSYAQLDRPSVEQQGNGGWWVLAEQLVYREQPAGTQGLTPFLNVAGAADDVNRMPLFLAFGVVYRGLFPDRNDDTTVFGLAWTAFSDALARRQRRGQRLGTRVRGPQDDELVLEVGHRFVLAPWFPWLSVQPDAQYVVDPSGTGDIPDALALGVQLNVTF